MNAAPALEAALREAGLQAQIKSQHDLSGGCIHRVTLITLGDDTRVIVKTNHARAEAMFHEESQSLQALSDTHTVVVPTPLVCTTHGETAVLLMTEVPARDPCVEGWQQFGRDLAALHATNVGRRYGWHIDNHIGSTRQVNAWHDDWVAFNAVNRLGFQLEMARDAGHMSESEANLIERVIWRLDRLIPRVPRPSLVHGDLWSGNVLPTRIDRNGRMIDTCAVIDPACNIGDALADIAMMRLFGGFSAACFAAYEECSGLKLDSEASLAAIAVYQLYHVLNHVNLFGGGYVGQAVSLARRLTGG